MHPSLFLNSFQLASRTESKIVRLTINKDNTGVVCHEQKELIHNLKQAIDNKSIAPLSHRHVIKQFATVVTNSLAEERNENRYAINLFMDMIKEVYGPQEDTFFEPLVKLLKNNKTDSIFDIELSPSLVKKYLDKLEPYNKFFPAGEKPLRLKNNIEIQIFDSGYLTGGGKAKEAFRCALLHYLHLQPSLESIEDGTGILNNAKDFLRSEPVYLEEANNIKEKCKLDGSNQAPDYITKTVLSVLEKEINRLYATQKIAHSKKLALLFASLVSQCVVSFNAYAFFKGGSGVAVLGREFTIHIFREEKSEEKYYVRIVLEKPSCPVIVQVFHPSQEKDQINYSLLHDIVVKTEMIDQAVKTFSQVQFEILYDEQNKDYAIGKITELRHEYRFDKKYILELMNEYEMKRQFIEDTYMPIAADSNTDPTYEN